jgi:ubiquinone/menaquinone biosynthesis C-methylase UbiE
MPIKLLNPLFEASINQKFRQRRFSFFLTLLKIISLEKPIQILDIGGTEIYWERMNFLKNKNIHITLLNLHFTEVKNKNVTSIKGDACDLSAFKDKQFDIVYSNSVIEHLFSKENQKKMADEVRRVGKYYYVQTPNYYFPIEPHWLFPVFQFLPFTIKVFMTQHLDLGNYKRCISREVAIERVNRVKLLTEKEMKKLFPDGHVYREVFLGLTKSVTMYNFPVS